MTKLAQLIAKEEGFGKPNVLPTLLHNPGDLRHSPHSSHAGRNPESIGAIDTDAHGWEDLERQLQLFAERGLTLEQAIYIFAPPTENNSEQYVLDVCRGLGLPRSTPLSTALKILA